MVVSTCTLHVALALLTREHLVHEWVVYLLFPAVRARAKSLKWTPLMVVADKSATLPVLAKFLGIIVEKVRLAAEVLPVVREFTLRLVVLFSQEGAPLGLEVVHKEVGVLGVLVNQPRLHIQLTVGKRAEVAVGAILSGLRAELGLVLFHMVETFHVAVSHVAEITLLARTSLLIAAQVRSVNSVRAAAVDSRMEIEAHLVLVCALLLTLLHLELDQAQMPNHLAVDLAEHLEEIVAHVHWAGRGREAVDTLRSKDPCTQSLIVYSLVERCLHVEVFLRARTDISRLLEHLAWSCDSLYVQLLIR